ncbi:hypothetical protein [Paenibacillus herberti]|uniref:Uncharacterized protein n=1 Tax=Paenibacillus herberti TaxID=1619309 RepID=A0A229NWP6_9BACL|nr:hypothetical protein [Paenibacillus herberti]OXM14333.1 hypothetical protein CGZ75_15395 [Paenibacillus herberti]
MIINSRKAEIRGFNGNSKSVGLVLFILLVIVICAFAPRSVADGGNLGIAEESVGFNIVLPGGLDGNPRLKG